MAVSKPHQGSMCLPVLPSTTTGHNRRASSQEVLLDFLTSLRYRAKLEHTSDDLSGTRYDLEAAREDRKRLQNETTAKDKKISDLHDTCDKFQSDAVSHAERLKEADARIKSLKFEKTTLKARNDFLEGETSA